MASLLFSSSSLADRGRNLATTRTFCSSVVVVVVVVVFVAGEVEDEEDADVDGKVDDDEEEEVEAEGYLLAGDFFAIGGSCCFCT